MSGASQEQSADFRRRARRNANPDIAALVLVHADGSEVEVPNNGAAQVAPGEEVELVVSWPVCPSAAVCGDDVCLPDETADACPEDCRPRTRTCEGAETYIRFDPVLREVVTVREAMRVAWIATAAGFEQPRTGVASDDPSSESRNRFVAPPAIGPVTLYVVLRDERGGTAWRTLTLVVTD